MRRNVAAWASPLILAPTTATLTLRPQTWFLMVRHIWRLWEKDMQVGFIGLGHMGQHMARHVAEAGHDVAAFDLRPEAGAAHAKRRAQ